MKKIRLYCFPFSGGSSSIYLQWFKGIDPHIEVCPVELAGHNKRFREPLSSSLHDTVRDLCSLLFPTLEPPYAMFGHSLGCLIIYEMVQTLMENHYPLPEHLFLSGGISPHSRESRRPLHSLEDQELIEEIVKMGGTPQEFLRHKEFQNIFLPIIRSDYKMFETYVPRKNKFQFPCNITVLAGEEDPLVTVAKAKTWGEYTKKLFRFVTYRGNHFFIQKKSQEIAKLISETLRSKAVDEWLK